MKLSKNNGHNTMPWYSSGKESQYLASKTIFVQKPIIARVTVDVKKKPINLLK